jgi:DNA-directed RNA polymerase specialized sigma24 family protein
MEYSNSQIREIIAEYIHSERGRKLMERRLIDGITYERLAEEFDVSVSQVKRIVMKNSETIFRHIPK